MRDVVFSRLSDTHPALQIVLRPHVCSTPEVGSSAPLYSDPLLEAQVPRGHGCWRSGPRPATLPTAGPRHPDAPSQPRTAHLPAPRRHEVPALPANPRPPTAPHLSIPPALKVLQPRSSRPHAPDPRPAHPGTGPDPAPPHPRLPSGAAGLPGGRWEIWRGPCRQRPNCQGGSDLP